MICGSEVIFFRGSATISLLLLYIEERFLYNFLCNQPLSPHKLIHSKSVDVGFFFGNSVDVGCYSTSTPYRSSTRGKLHRYYPLRRLTNVVFSLNFILQRLSFSCAFLFSNTLNLKINTYLIFRGVKTFYA